MAISLSHYRFGVDELAESTHGWYAAEDTNPTQGQIPLDTTFLLRFVEQCDATSLSNVDGEFQYRKNGGTWTNITTTSTVVKAVAATALTNGSNCTQRLSGTGTFESSGAGQTEDGTSGGTANDIVANGNSETECGLQLLSAGLTGGDVVEFRLTRDGGILFDSYLVTPTITIPRTLTGAAFTSPASLPAGNVAPPGITLTGVAFTSPAAFPTGQLSLRLNGAAFASPAAFPTGALSLRVGGAAFPSPAAFPTGQVNLPGAGWLATQLRIGSVIAPRRRMPPGGTLTYHQFPWNR